MSENDREKSKTAVALEYIPGETAPQIVATGKGHVADKIIEVAKEKDVPIHEDAKLAGTLSKLEIGDYIPEELYGVVAEVLVMVDRAENKFPRKKG